MISNALPLSLPALLALLVAAFGAGWIDAVVGGGGLIQLPALMLGLPAAPTAQVLATNKFASFCGTLSASTVYVRNLAVSARTAVPIVVGAYAGSSLGAFASRHIPRAALTPIVLVAVIVVGTIVATRPRLGTVHAPRHEGAAATSRLGAIGLAVGIYDGMIGPGTGTFFVIALVAVMGFGFLHASVYAKLANLTTNVAALVIYGVHGDVLWILGALMAVANISGGILGARAAVRRGNEFIRRVFLIAVSILAIRLACTLV